jgi:Family of unknown function (DUF6879)
MGKPVSDDELADLLRTFERTAFRLETQDAYPDAYEQEDLALFLAGTPRTPDELGWFRPWADQVRRQTRQGKQISRVRVQSEPPTGYQRWERWVGAWNIAAGEDIRYMTRSEAGRIGLPLDHDWWLLDGRRLVVMRFAGNVRTQELITDPITAGEYASWQDVAFRNAAPAERVAAA